jgi:hypothetical protein
VSFPVGHRFGDRRLAFCQWFPLRIKNGNSVVERANFFINLQQPNSELVSLAGQSSVFLG